MTTIVIRQDGDWTVIDAYAQRQLRAAGLYPLRQFQRSVATVEDRHHKTLRGIQHDASRCRQCSQRFLQQFLNLCPELPLFSDSSARQIVDGQRDYTDEYGCSSISHGCVLSLVSLAKLLLRSDAGHLINKCGADYNGGWSRSRSVDRTVASCHPFYVSIVMLFNR